MVRLAYIRSIFGVKSSRRGSLHFYKYQHGGETRPIIMQICILLANYDVCQYSLVWYRGSNRIRCAGPWCPTRLPVTSPRQRPTCQQSWRGVLHDTRGGPGKKLGCVGVGWNAVSEHYSRMPLPKDAPACLIRTILLNAFSGGQYLIYARRFLKPERLLPVHGAGRQILYRYTETVTIPVAVIVNWNEPNPSHLPPLCPPLQSMPVSPLLVHSLALVLH